MTRIYEVRQVEGDFIEDNYFSVGYSLTKDGAKELQAIAEKMAKASDDDNAEFEIEEMEIDKILSDWTDMVEGRSA